MALEVIRRYPDVAARDADTHPPADIGKLVIVQNPYGLYRIQQTGGGAGQYVDTAGGGSGEILLTKQLTDVDLTAAAGTQQFAMGHSFVAGEIPTKLRIKVDVLGTGGTLTDLQLDVGTTGIGGSLQSGIDAFAGPVYDAGTTAMQGFTTINPAFDLVGNDVIIDVNATGDNVNNITAFDATIYVTIGTAGT